MKRLAIGSDQRATERFKSAGNICMAVGKQMDANGIKQKECKRSKRNQKEKEKTKEMTSVVPENDKIVVMCFVRFVLRTPASLDLLFRLTSIA